MEYHRERVDRKCPPKPDSNLTMKGLVMAKDMQVIPKRLICVSSLCIYYFMRERETKMINDFVIHCFMIDASLSLYCEPLWNIHLFFSFSTYHLCVFINRSVCDSFINFLTNCSLLLIQLLSGQWEVGAIFLTAASAWLLP